MWVRPQKCFLHPDLFKNDAGPQHLSGDKVGALRNKQIVLK